ncbi:MAG: hypothetical protein ACYTGP_05630 [Planctomycetota bacterium]|jgi:hypothetical protein
MRLIPRSWTALGCVIAALLLLPVAPAAGQGTDGALADPVSTRELLGYADRLELSTQQRAGLESIHDQYKHDFRVLRDGDIAKFLAESRKMQNSGRMPDRKVVQTMFERMEKLQTRIRTLDDRLFDQLQPMLTEEQLSMLPRVRLQRERTRYQSSQMMWMMGSPAVDISGIVRELELEGETLITVDALMATYERRFTSELRKLSSATHRMFLDVLDRLNELGFGEMTQEEMMENPEKMQEMMQAMQSVWQEVTAKAQEIATGVQALNDNAYTGVSAVLESGQRRSFRNDYYQKAYPMVGHMLMQSQQPWLDRVVAIDDLTDDEREGLQATIDDHHRKLDRIVEEAVKLAKESRRERNPFNMGESMQEFNEQIAKLSQRSNELLAQSMQTVRDIIGAERFARLQQATLEEAQQSIVAAANLPAGAVVVQSGTTQVSGDDAEEKVPEYRDQLVPSRITRADVKWYARRLGLDEGGLAVLDELYLGYLEKTKTMKSLEKTRTAVQTLWKYDAETGVSTPPSTADIERVYQIRREAFTEIANLDETFFADVAVAVATEEQAPIMARIRADRARARFNIDHNMGWGQHSSEGNIDLIRFLSKRQVSDAELALIDGALRSYETGAAAPFAERYEAILAMQKAQELMSAEMTSAATADQAEAMEYGMRYREVVQPLSARITEVKQAIVKLNQETMAAVLAALAAGAEGEGASDTGRSIRMEYNRLAFPEVYKDPMSIEKHLATSLTFEDLTPEQQGQLNELAVGYRPEYAGYCEQMIELSAGASYDPFAAFAQQDWSEYQKLNSKLEKLRFDRNELNFRAIARLRDVLTEQQLQRLGGLPEMKEDRSAIFW